MLDKKSKIIGVVTLVVLLVIIVGITYAYFADDSFGGAETINVSVNTKTIDSTIFTVGPKISLVANSITLGEETEDILQAATWAQISFKKGNQVESSTTNYYVYLDITNNEFIYTSKDESENDIPELILQITGPDGNQVDASAISKLNYVIVTDKDNNTIQGFDITGYTGTIAIANNRQLTSTSSSESSVERWTVNIVFVNLDTNQKLNKGKTLNGSLIIQKDKMSGGTFAEQILADLYTTDGENGLYYHDGEGSYTNVSEEAGDKSYRFAGSNNVVKNNYVCFGADLDENGDCDSSNLYRIIGVFNKNFEDSSATPEYQVKLIKSEAANATQLGTGTGTYAWDSSNSNTWSTASLKELLNNYYINTYLDKTNNGKWSRMIDLDHTWKVGGNNWGKIGTQTVKTAYTNEIVNPNATNSTDNKTEDTFAIGLMYVSDYMYAVAPSGWKTLGYTGGNDDYRGLTVDNWLYLGGSHEWTISRISDVSGYVFPVASDGYVSNSGRATTANVARPVFYLNSSVLYGGGNGEAGTPYIVKLD